MNLHFVLCKTKMQVVGMLYSKLRRSIYDHVTDRPLVDSQDAWRL